MKKFSELDFEILSNEDVQTKSSDALKAIEKAESAEQQIELIKEFDKIRKSVQTVICFGMIKGQLDCNDKKYMGAYALFPLLNSMSVQFFQTITKSKFQDELKEHFGERIFEIANHQLNCTTPEALALEQKAFAIAGEYDRACANSTYEIDGETVSFAKLQLYMESPDENLRKQACKLWSNFFKTNEELFDEIYDKLIKNRTQQAKLLGFENYTDYSYVKWSRMKYSETDVKAFRDAIVKYIVPVNEKLRKAQAKRIGVEKLKFQDEGCKFTKGNAKPLGGEEVMVKKAQEMYAEMSPKTKEYFDKVVKYGYYDLESRQGKKQGGVCIPLIDEGLPFVYTNFNGTIQDFRVLVHESGHGYHSYLNMNSELFDYLKTSSETGETHSMSMEFLSWNWAEKFMGEDAEKYKFSHLAEAANFMPYGCMLDEYQHVVHTSPDMTKAERKAAFAEIEKKYFPTKDYDGDTFLESGTLWYKQQHLFNSAFYYIDYVLAEINALQLWAISRKDWDKAFEMYNTFCHIGGRKCFVDAVEAAGLQSPFAEETVVKIAECMNEYIDSVDQSNM